MKGEYSQFRRLALRRISDPRLTAECSKCITWTAFRYAWVRQGSGPFTGPLIAHKNSRRVAPASISGNYSPTARWHSPRRPQLARGPRPTAVTMVWARAVRPGPSVRSAGIPDPGYPAPGRDHQHDQRSVDSVQAGRRCPQAPTGVLRPPENPGSCTTLNGIR